MKQESCTRQDPLVINYFYLFGAICSALKGCLTSTELLDFTKKHDGIVGYNGTQTGNSRTEYTLW
jgi:hypothetical protein